VPCVDTASEHGVAVTGASRRALAVHGADTTSDRQAVMTLGPLAVDATRRMMTISGQELATTPTEYRLVSILLGAGR
jgi:DNA-binding response OmpR family regulator